MTQTKNIADKVEPYIFLKQFYDKRGVEEIDLTDKMKIMTENTVIPNFDYSTRNPALYELEIQFLIDNGYEFLRTGRNTF